MGGISNNPQVSNYGNVGFQGAQAGQGVKTNTFQGFTDGSSSLGGVSKNEPYLQDMKTPALSPATLGLSDAPNRKQGDADYSPTNAFYDSFAENLQNVADQHDLSEEQVNKLLFSHLTGAPSDDAFINQLLTEVDAQVAADMAELFELPSTADQASNLKKRAGSHSSSVKDQIAELQSYADSLPDGSEKRAIQDKINQMTKNLDSFNNQLNSLPDNPSREQLAKLSAELEQSGENLKNLSSELSELGKNNPKLQALAAKFESSINSSVNQLDSLLQELGLSYQISQGNYNGLTEGFQQFYESKLTQAYDAEFEAQLEKHTDDPELQAQLRFAHYNPDANVGKGIRSMTEQLQQAAINQLNAEGWAIPESYTPLSDSSAYAFKMQSAADDMLEALLDNYVNPDGTILTESQKNQVRNMYYGVTPQSGVLGDIAKDMEATIGAELATAFGLPSGSPVPKGAGHALSIDGSFQLKFMELLNSLSPEKKAEVMKAINDPMSASISEETKQLLNQLFNQAANSVRAEYGLPGDWSPSASALRKAVNVAPTYQSAAATISGMETQVALAITYVEQWPNSPTRAMLLNVLKIVSDAISQLKQQLGIMMQLDAEISTKLGQAHLDTALLKVHEQLQKLEEIKEAQEKQQKMAALGPLFTFIEVIIATLTMGFAMMAGPILGPVIAAAVAANFVLKQTDALGEDMGLFKYMFETVMKKMQEMFGEQLGWFVAALLTMAIIGPMIAANPMLGIQMFFEDSSLIQSFLTDVAGAEEMTAQIIAMSIQMITEIILMIILTVMTGGAGASILVANITAKVAQAAAKAAHTVSKLVMRIAQWMQRIASHLRRFGRLGQMAIKGAEKVGTKMGKLSSRIAQYQDDLMRYSDDLINTAKEISDESKNLKKVDQAGRAWKTGGKQQSKFKEATNQVKDQIRIGRGKTGHPKLDNAVKHMDDQLKVMQYVWEGIGLVYLGVQVHTVVVQFSNSMLAAKIARIRGEMESMMVELEAFIKVLKKLLEKILESLTSTGQWIGQIGQQQGSMWKELSQTMDAVASANQAS